MTGFGMSTKIKPRQKRYAANTTILIELIFIESISCCAAIELAIAIEQRYKRFDVGQNSLADGDGAHASPR